LIGFLGARAIPGVELVEPRRYRRTVELDGVRGTLEVQPLDGEPALALALRLPAAFRARVVARVRRLFDLDADPREIGRVLGADRQLASLVRARPGLRVPGAWDGFELAVRAILGQQVTVRGATTLAGRLVAAHGQPLDGTGGLSPPLVTDALAPPLGTDGLSPPLGTGGLTHLFPTAARLKDADLTALGLVAARARAIAGLAAAVDGGALALDAGPLEQAVARLVALSGIGPWTAHYIAMRALGQPDAFPSGDLGLRRALGLSERALERRAEAWRPWRAYAAMHLWASLTPEKEPR
jgi:AraC family transcriptional regulator of adaptative response / DNA-3-methyladenine glycosylase II